ncbi:4-oxalocrotonate tautomerase [Mycena chlorophos]|uniref:4-oxalocrotonate tautomerase n=1 Tax=Mycena chlorophos TaxID=658473 RepID=A0A8H6SRB3_MYCCL|nr:4-oxalocrotonate tautomerase [Mycena chlorophos]
MPIHRWIVPKGLYTPADKEALANAISDIYEKHIGLPRFYVVVFFIEQEAHDFYYGGKPVGGAGKTQFVRVDIEHIARNFATDAPVAEKHGFLDMYESVVAPWTKDRGVNWEVQIKDVCDRDLWHEDGRPPPAIGSVEEQIWKKENRPVPDEELAAIKAAM